MRTYAFRLLSISMLLTLLLPVSPSPSLPALADIAPPTALASGTAHLVSGEMDDRADVSVADRQPGTTTRVSVAGTEGNDSSYRQSISADGRYVAFASYASNLVSRDTNNSQDIFMHDRQSGVTARVSISWKNTQGDGYSGYPAISADGRYVAFVSDASNLVSGDTNGISDVFVRCRENGSIQRVSIDWNGVQGNSSSFAPAISANGRYVAFESYATNLVSGDTNGMPDIFVHDRLGGTTSRISVASDGTQGNSSSFAPSISADERYVAFYSYASNLVSGDTNGMPDIFVHDRQSGVTTRVSVASDGTQGNGDSHSPFISADGRYVVFGSSASNLVSGDTNGEPDVFVHDRLYGITSRVSVASDGTQGNGVSYNSAISADGRYVVFASYASNLVGGDMNDRVDVFVHDRQSGVTSCVSVASGGTQGNDGSYIPVISTDGRYVAFHSDATNLVSWDTNGATDVFVHDRQSGITSRVSVASEEVEGNDGSSSPAISAEGRHVAFDSSASNLAGGDTNDRADVFMYDRQRDVTSRVSVASNGAQGNASSYAPATSADGRYVAFVSPASNLVSGDTNGIDDIFVHDRQSGVTCRVSVASGGTQSNSHSSEPIISADGRYVAFASEASNLVSGDTNGVRDIFVHDRQSGVTARVSIASDGTQGNGNSFAPAISANGRYVAFYSSASNLVSGDTNNATDAFVHDRQSGVTARASVASDGSQGNGGSYYPALSADGRYVAFHSDASNLVSGDTNGVTDILVHDRQSGVTSRVSVASDSSQGNDGSYYPAISTDGRYVAFVSYASNLVGGDTNGWADIFMHDRQSGVTARASVASDGTQSNGYSFAPVISADGRLVAFDSSASNLVSGDTNSASDVFVHENGVIQIYLPLVLRNAH